jgi:DNA-binding GntR family transcriptional regulator
MIVSTVEIRDLASLSEVRGVLEAEAAHLAAERATPAEREELAALVAELDRHDARDQRALMAFDERIHRTIYRCAHNAFLAETLEEYYVLALRIWHLALEQAAELEAAVQEHRALLVAIRDGDGKQAAHIVRTHVDDFEAAMHRVLVGQ